jgi:hypothetical protein
MLAYNDKCPQIQVKHTIADKIHYVDWHIGLTVLDLEDEMLLVIMNYHLFFLPLHYLVLLTKWVINECFNQ